MLREREKKSLSNKHNELKNFFAQLVHICHFLRRGGGGGVFEIKFLNFILFLASSFIHSFIHPHYQRRQIMRQMDFLQQQKSKIHYAFRNPFIFIY